MHHDCIPDLMLATGSSRPTVKKALRLLVRLGYLVPLTSPRAAR